MRKKLSLILCIAMFISLMPVTSAFAAKKIKAKSVSVSPKAMTLAVGDIAQLKATKKPTNSTDKLTWTSSDKSVATVTSSGVVQGKKEGTATITVKTTSKKTANCVVTVKNYATEAELRESLKEELKAEFMKKDDLQAYLDQHVYGKAEIDSMFAGISTNGFATKDELQSLSQNTYTKSQIDEKISAITPNGSSASCNCEIKTNNDVVNVIKQNTYTKDEIDSKIAAIPSGDSCNCNKDMKPSDISIIPDYSCTFELCEYVNSPNEIKPSVNIDTVSVDEVFVNSYNDFLKTDKKERGDKDWPGNYYKYTTKISFTGSISPDFAHKYVQLEFAGNSTDRQNWSNGFAEIQEDGSFSGVCNLETNYYPTEVILAWVNVWYDYDEAHNG